MSLRSRAIVGIVVLLAVVAGAGYLRQPHSKFTSQVKVRSTSHAAEPPAAINFHRDKNAYLAATRGNLFADLQRVDSYAAARIASYGIEVDVVGPPSAAIRAVVARDDPLYQGKPIPIHYQSVRHDRRELLAVANRITADAEYWRRQGIKMLEWGPYPVNNTVQITLAHKTDAAEAAIIARYGGDLVTVVS